MIMAIPINATDAPIRSHNVGLMPSIAQSQSIATEI